MTDEFYWAAAEMYITTGEAEFEQDLMSNTYWNASTSTMFQPGGFSWGSTAALGQLSLAVVPNNITDRQAIIASVIAGAEEYMAVQAGQWTGVMMTTYPWGSNSKLHLHRTANQAS